MRTFIRLFVFTLIFAVGLPAAALVAAEEKLPDGFIALSDTKMAWDEAKAWCEQRGGRLPLIGGSESLGGRAPIIETVPTGTPIDGFGARSDPWPPGLPIDYYWTGTADSDYPSYSWIITRDDFVRVNNSPQSDTLRVVCVPK